MNIEKRKLSELQHATYNPRVSLRPEDKEYQKIKKSIEHFGYVDPIIINSDNTIIGGHQRSKILHDLGYDEVDCVVVELSKNDEKALNIALNKLDGEWDIDALSDLLSELKNTEIDLNLTGFDNIELKDMLNFEDDIKVNDKYTSKAAAIHYKITGEKPAISELMNDDKTNDLIEEIEESNLPQSEKNFLIDAAMRHLVFDYSKIAEYYAHSNKEMQKLMEKSALVIIDFDDAIKNGYVQLSSKLSEMYEEDENR